MSACSRRRSGAALFAGIALFYVLSSSVFGRDEARPVTIELGVDLRGLSGEGGARASRRDRRDLARRLAFADRRDPAAPRGAGGLPLSSARSSTSRLVGFVYGYLGAEGQWWHDRVAAALGEDGDDRWLAQGHFEFTELHVHHPEFRRRGIGGRSTTAAPGLDAPTAVLSTQTDNEPAISLYAGRGWQVIVPYLDFGSAAVPDHGQGSGLTLANRLDMSPIWRLRRRLLGGLTHGGCSPGHSLDPALPVPLYVLLMILQVFFAGEGIFGARDADSTIEDAKQLDLHRGFGFFITKPGRCSS